LALPLDALRESARRSDVEIDAQVQSSEDNREAVQMLEAQFDALLANRASNGSDLPTADLPMGEDIAAQVERYLAQRDSHGTD
jgi:hypothetical protein